MRKIKNFFEKPLSLIDQCFMAAFVALTMFVQGNIFAANTFGDMAKTVSDQFSNFAVLIKYGSFLIGLYLVITGFNDMRQAREKQTTIGACAIKVAIGFILCSVIFIIETGTASLGGSDVGLKEIL